MARSKTKFSSEKDVRNWIRKIYDKRCIWQEFACGATDGAADVQILKHKNIVPVELKFDNKNKYGDLASPINFRLWKPKLRPSQIRVSRLIVAHDIESYLVVGFPEESEPWGCELKSAIQAIDSGELVKIVLAVNILPRL